jgi:hypothetical protein
MDRENDRQTDLSCRVLPEGKRLKPQNDSHDLFVR